MPEIGQIVVEHLPSVVVVALCGEHDASTVAGLKTELAATAAAGNAIVDLSEATFIDSRVVGVLFQAAATPGRIVAIAAAPGTLPRRLIDMVALSTTIPLFDSRVAAVAYATRSASSS